MVNLLKNQWSNDISSDQQGLGSAIFWGAKYKFNDQVNASYYGVDVKDKLERHYANANYSFPTASGASVTLDAMGYNTKWKVGAETTDPRSETEELTRFGVYLQAITGTHNLMLAYQDNAGNIGYDYAYNADGLQSIYVPNSYLSDFKGNDEKSVGLQYNYNFKNHGLPGLNWTTALVYGWDIDVAEKNNPAQIIDQS